MLRILIVVFVYHGLCRLSTAFIFSNGLSIRVTKPASNLLRAQQQQQSDPSPSRRLGRRDGVYSRPSGALERGSGFFIPGLEGPKIRLVSGTVLLLAIGLNHLLSESSTSMEGLAVVYALLVLLQGAVQFRLENQTSPDADGGAGKAMEGPETYQLVWSVPVDDLAWRSRVEWSARTLTSLTVCSHAILLCKESVILSYGIATIPGDNYDTLQTATMDTIAQSKSGRVSLPSSHPVISCLDPNCRESVILQRCGEICWVLASDRPLAGYTASDLQWIGQMMGKYSALDFNSQK